METDTSTKCISNDLQQLPSYYPETRMFLSNAFLLCSFILLCPFDCQSRWSGNRKTKRVSRNILVLLLFLYLSNRKLQLFIGKLQCCTLYNFYLQILQDILLSFAVVVISALSPSPSSPYRLVFVVFFTSLFHPAAWPHPENSSVWVLPSSHWIRLPPLLVPKNPIYHTA